LELGDPVGGKRKPRNLVNLDSRLRPDDRLATGSLSLLVEIEKIQLAARERCIDD